jgi:hypothetical protein
MISLKQGTELVHLVRKAVEKYLLEKEFLKPPSRSEFGKMGCFVSIHSHPGHALRGCIGVPIAVKPLEESVIYSALNAAFNDPRFPPLEKEELNHVVFEVSALTPLKKIDCKPEELPEKIVVGRDGLVIECGGCSGLLLPQVPVEYSWDSREFLQHLCEKAGLPRGEWKNSSARVSCFQAQVFCEETPEGKVVEKFLF